MALGSVPFGGCETQERGAGSLRNPAATFPSFPFPSFVIPQKIFLDARPNSSYYVRYPSALGPKSEAGCASSLGRPRHHRRFWRLLSVLQATEKREKPSIVFHCVSGSNFARPWYKLCSVAVTLSMSRTAVDEITRFVHD